MEKGKHLPTLHRGTLIGVPLYSHRLLSVYVLFLRPLQWLGPPTMRSDLEGRIIKVNLACQETLPTPDPHGGNSSAKLEKDEAFSPTDDDSRRPAVTADNRPNYLFNMCIGFRVSGSPRKCL